MLYVDKVVLALNYYCFPWIIASNWNAGAFLKNFNFGLQLKNNGKADYKIQLYRAFFLCLYMLFWKIFFQDYLMFYDTLSKKKLSGEGTGLYVVFCTSTCTCYQCYSCQDSHRTKLTWAWLNVWSTSFKTKTLYFCHMFLSKSQEVQKMKGNYTWTWKKMKFPYVYILIWVEQKLWKINKNRECKD